MSDTLRDPRAYLQKRVALFTGVTCLFFTGVLLVDLSISVEGEPIWSSTRLSNLAVTVSNAAVWRYARRGERPAWACRALELAAIAVAMGVLATLPLHPPVEGAGGAMAVFSPISMAVVVLLRAATIPSQAWLSVAVGLTWGGVMTASSTIGWEGISLSIPAQPEGEPWKLPFSFSIFATIAFSLVAGIISHVVYGLQTKVREAMQLGQYTLETKIGEGGMGLVYQARHAMLRRPTAVKLLTPQKTSERAVARFEQEVQQTARLTHPNTVTVFDYGRTPEGVFYYAMELIEGATLGDIVAHTGPQSAARVIHILTHTAGALAEAHDAGLTHRDIKPANIMLCERGGVFDTVKVLDFGLVKELSQESAVVSLTSAAVIQGTPQYMPPEAISAPDTVDERTDIYALGAVGYYLITGEHVFEGGSAVEVCSHHLHTIPTPPSERLGHEVSSDLEALLMSCLEKDPTMRPQSAAALQDALRGCRDVGVWSAEHARGWWAEHGAVLRAAREETATSGSARTIGIDLGRR